MREQVEEGGEEPSSRWFFLHWAFWVQCQNQHFMKSPRTAGIWVCAVHTMCQGLFVFPRYVGLVVLSVSVNCPEMPLSQSFSGAAEAIWGQGSTNRGVARGSHSFRVTKHELFHARGKLWMSVLGKSQHKLLQPVLLHSFTFPCFSWWFFLCQNLLNALCCWGSFRASSKVWLNICESKAICAQTLQWSRSKCLGSDCSGTMHTWLLGPDICTALRAVTTTVKLKIWISKYCRCYIWETPHSCY